MKFLLKPIKNYSLINYFLKSLIISLFINFEYYSKIDGNKNFYISLFNLFRK